MPASIQSIFGNAGVAAEAIGELTVVLFAGGAIIFVLMMGLALHAATSASRRASSNRWILGGGLVFPSIVLAALLVYGLHVTNALSTPDGAPLTIHVTGKRWWWEVRYPDPAGGKAPIVSANEVHVPVGRAVELKLDTEDVIHSFWVPALAGKIDMIPGRVTRLVIRASRAGIYRGQCAEYCGAQHAFMAFYVVAHEPADFERWLEGEARAAAEPQDSNGIRGRAVFVSAGCAGCHSVRGTPASARVGPDLTHVASRRSLGAGMFDNTRGVLAGWIADSQGLKPGNLMPPTGVSGEELLALVAYVEGLR